MSTPETNTGGGGMSESTERPAGTVDEDANPPLTTPEKDVHQGEQDQVPPQGTESAVPPYEGRQ